MENIEVQPGNPEAIEPEPYVIDAELAARLFWVGVRAGEQQLQGDEMLKVFQGTIMNSYPSTEKFEEAQKMKRAFLKVTKEAKKDGRL